MTTQTRRVLMLTLPFGSGHARAAAAIASELKRCAPGGEIHVQLVDALAGSRLLFRAGYVWPYWAMLRFAPRLWRWVFCTRVRRNIQQTAPAWAFRLGCGQAFQEIARFEPDVIVAAEVGACEIAAIARERGLTTAALVNVVTDHHAEPAWVKPEVDAYCVADEGVREQLCGWGAPRERVFVSGIPTDRRFGPGADLESIRVDGNDTRPLVLLMGGGMGPTRMERIAAGLCATGRPMHVVAVAGHDARARRRLGRLRTRGETALTVHGWTENVPALMRCASVLVTKPGGVTTAEAAECGVATVLFDPIPGPEEDNAARLVRSGATVLTRGAAETVAATLALLDDAEKRVTMAASARRFATPSASEAVAKRVLRVCDDAVGGEMRQPVLILTIRNGAGHTRVAEAIAGAVKTERPRTRVCVLDVANYMTPAARFTHVSAYLWLVRHAPQLWDRIDRFQKRRRQTSPEWYYRRGCRSLFRLAHMMRPQSMIATEVGCCEIAALIKRDLGLACPLVAVNGEYDADRAWIQPEVDLYSVPTVTVAEELCAFGAERERVRAWGVPLAPEFGAAPNRAAARAAASARLALSPELPIVLISGGSEGLGRPDAVARRLLALHSVNPQVVVLAGRNDRLKRRCEQLSRRTGGRRLRVLGWTREIRELMEAADLLVSKLGHTFDEAIATALPIVALDPPPGSERVQFRLLEEWGVGRGVHGLDEMAHAVESLLGDASAIEAMRRAAIARRNRAAAHRIARWIDETTTDATSTIPASNSQWAAAPAGALASREYNA